VANPAARPGTVPRSGFDPVEKETVSIGDAARYNDALAREVTDLEERCEVLKVRYEQWLMGVERRAPQREREELKREIARVKNAFTRNTGLRFRIQSLHARFISYERLWQRSVRQKEEGTYRRDVERARRAAQAAASPAREAPAPAARPTAAPVAAAPAPPGRVAPPARAASHDIPGLSDDQVRALHAEFVAAKQRCNEDSSRFTVEALAKTLAKQVPALLAKVPGRDVDFRVGIKDGKTVLRAVPRAGR
jgi:hypothetical protein